MKSYKPLIRTFTNHLSFEFSPCSYCQVKAITKSPHFISITDQVRGIVFPTSVCDRAVSSCQKLTHTCTYLPLFTARQFLTLDGQKTRLRSGLKAHFAALCMSRNDTIIYRTIKRKIIYSH